MLRKRYLDIDVVEATKKRIIQAFQQNIIVGFSISGGKDSIVLADIIYKLILQDKIDKRLLQIHFIDEEAMFDDVIDIVKKWRLKFLEIGVKFNWYCVQVKHFNCLNSMEEDESFICWDEKKKDTWIREKPDFAITDDEYLIPRKDTYQEFLHRKFKRNNWIDVRGVRIAESVQRRYAIASKTSKDLVYPIYDWEDKDVWLYILKNNIEIPIAYENLYRVGATRREMRISQFFSIDTSKVLVKLNEMYPDLMERVEKREPNAYLCALYWDSEMFGRRTKKRKELEEEDHKDYRALVLKEMETTKHKKLAKSLKPYLLDLKKDSSLWKDIYAMFLTGDPKSRKLRRILVDIQIEQRSV